MLCLHVCSFLPGCSILTTFTIVSLLQYYAYTCSYYSILLYIHVYILSYSILSFSLVRLPARNGLVNEVEFLGLITQNG